MNNSMQENQTHFGLGLEKGTEVHRLHAKPNDGTLDPEITEINFLRVALCLHIALQMLLKMYYDLVDHIHCAFAFQVSVIQGLPSSRN